MTRKLLNFVIFAGIAALAWFLGVRFEKATLTKVAYSFIAIAVAYLLLKLVLDGLLGQKIRDPKARYSFRKISQFLFVVASLLIVMRIWIVSPKELVVAYGLVAAGVAIALQDVVKNFAGSTAIMLGGIYRVGDRIEVNSEYGDVIDLGLFYTTLLELRGWVDGDQTTGRLTRLPNGQVLSQPVHNYTKDHSFIWDEMTLPITYNSDWKKAVELIQSIISAETLEATKKAEQEVAQLQEKYYLSTRNIEPTIFITPTDNWITLSIRYVVEVRERRLVHNRLSRLILEAVQQSSDITIASQTYTITTYAHDMTAGH